MIKHNLLVLVLLGLFVPSSVLVAQEREEVKSTLEFESDLSDSVYSVAPLSPVWTQEGHIYDAHVNAKQELVVTQKTPTGKINTHVVYAGVRPDNHNAPSLAVDRSGYIHVTGDLHNGNAKGQWSYWVSTKPHDISAFTFRGGSVWKEPKTWLPSNMPSYVLFRPDNKDQLYVTWRGRLLSRTDIGSYRAVMLATLPGETPGPWTPLGVAHPKKKHWPGTGIAWEDYVRPMKASGTGTSTYQTLRGHTWFDARNRLHMAWVVFGPGSQTPGDPEKKNKVGSGATHIMYARSRDGGKTWRDSRKKKLSLPIQLEKGGVVLRRNPGDLTTQVYLTVTKDGRPVISYSVGGLSQHGEHFMIVADKKGRWSSPMKLPAEQWDTYRVVADRNGVLTLPGSKVWYRSHDEGASWIAYKGLPPYHGGGAASIDYRHLRETGEIRFHGSRGEKGSRTVQVWTVAFTAKP